MSFSDLLPSKKPFPSVLPKGLVWDGVFCFLGLSVFRAFSPLDSETKRLPLLHSLTLFCQHTLTSTSSFKPQGLSSSSLAFPTRGASPPDLLSPNCHILPL
jgi:hypothetical protein